MNELSSRIREAITKNGPISFRDFMQMALYEPGLGYYAKGRDQLGFAGDFYTSCTLSPSFGYAIARQLHEIWRVSGLKDFTIVEYGAGTGDLCLNILQAFESMAKLDGELRYHIIEISPGLRERQQAKLPKEVTWNSRIEEIRGFSGVVLSNELFDNFPVYRVRMESELMELRVETTQDRFADVAVPAAPELKTFFDEMRVVLPKGYQAEVNLDAARWTRDVAAAMENGLIMTIDYGYLSGDLYGPSRSHGTLTCYHRHKTNENWYQNIGEQDISSHVNFSSLAKYAMDNGYQLTGFRGQGPFLRSLGIEQMLKEEDERYDLSASAVRRERAVAQTLLGDMGSRFKVLLVQKNLSPMRLQGFQS